MFLNPKDFAIALGIKESTLRQHIKRKKLFKSGRKIDTDFEPNKVYIHEQSDGKGLDFTKISNRKSSKTKKVENTGPDVKLDEENSKPAPTKDELNLNSWMMRKKKADSEKAEKENQLKDIELAKKRGELIPTELVRTIMTVNIQTIIRSFEIESDNIASIYCEILGGDRSHLAEMVSKMREHLQKAIIEAKEKSASDIKNAIKLYAKG